LPAIFITGTGTGVGKTFITGGLAVSMLRQNINVNVIKPIASGGKVRNGSLVSDDALILQQAIGDKLPISVINPICYHAPLAPAVAAELEKSPLDLDKAKNSIKSLEKESEILLIEGIGGLMVPLSYDYLVLDLIKELDTPIIIVSDSRLGTLNHTILSVSAAKSRNVEIIGIILNCSLAEKPSLAEKTNPVVLKRYLNLPIWGPVPHQLVTAFAPDLNNDAIKAIEDYIDVGYIINYVK